MTATCPECGAEGELGSVLAPGQYWCPTDRGDCRVVSFVEKDFEK